MDPAAGVTTDRRARIGVRTRCQRGDVFRTRSLSTRVAESLTPERARRCESTRVERVVGARWVFGVPGPRVEIEQDRVVAGRFRGGDHRRDIGDHDVDARIDDGTLRARRQRPATPRDDFGIELDHVDRDAGRCIERGAQRVPHAEAGDESACHYGRASGACARKASRVPPPSGAMCLSSARARRSRTGTRPHRAAGARGCRPRSRPPRGSATVAPLRSLARLAVFDYYSPARSGKPLHCVRMFFSAVGDRRRSSLCSCRAPGLDEQGQAQRRRSG